MCNGDPARRSGNEYIFQMLAMQNIETLDGMGVKKIITQCPHCFNMLKNEYPQLGGNYEVVHHSQLLDELVATGACRSRARRSRSASPTTTPATSAATTTCTSRPARSSARSPASTSSRCRATAPRACAAAPAARACGWRRRIGKKVNIERSQEAIATGAERIAVACPFCYVMFDDGVKGEGKDEEVKVQDIAEILLEAIENERLARARRSRADHRPGL